MAWVEMRGGKREGAGRPVGWRKENPNPRPRRQLTAYDDEWELIKRFQKMMRLRGAEFAENILTSNDA